MPSLPFLHPAVFLTGLGAVSVPILIHLLNRRRYRMLDWAAMRFLWESLRRNRRRLRIEELILLALRCLVLLVLAAALARFTGCSAMAILPGGAESQTAVFLLDDSYSTGQRLGGGTVFAAATTDVVEQLRKLSENDQVAILRTSENASDPPFFPLTHVAKVEIASLATRVSGLEPSDRRARLADGLTKVARLLAGDKSTTRRLFLHSDFRQVDLAGPAEAEAIRKAFAELGKLDVEVVALDFGRRATNNLTIERLEMVDKFAVAGVPTRVRLEVRNHGESMARDIEVRLTARLSTPQGLQEVQLPNQVIESVDRRSKGKVEFELTPPHAGPAVLVARLQPDELAGDNQAHLALDVRESLNVLVVDGRGDLSDPLASESFLFRYALDPAGDAGYGAKVEVVVPDGLSGMDLRDFDLVALLNVGEMPVLLDANGSATYPMLDALERYVRKGGGVVVFTGDRVNLTFYNEQMYANGSGLSPFRLGARKGDPRKREEFFRLDPKSLSAEPVLETFRRFQAAGIDPTQFIRFYAFHSTNPITSPPASPDIKPPRVLARFADSDHSPAIASRQFGRGVVLMVYTTANLSWTDWPADENGTFVAMLHDMLAYLARPQGRLLSVPVGEPIVFELRDRLRDATVTLKTPRHPAEPVIPLPRIQQKADDAAEVWNFVRYDRAASAGQYTLELALPDGTTRQVLFARTVDPAEGDLTPGRESAIAAAFGSEEFRYFDRTAAQPGAVTTGARKEYWTWALAIVLLLMAAETFLGQRFGHYQP